MKTHNKIYDYSKVTYVKSIRNVEIICKIHGSFYQTPNAHLGGRNCPKCVGGIEYDQNEYIEKAKMVHSNKYDYSKVDYINSYTKICILCPIHGAFYQIPKSHLWGTGCSKCVSRISKPEMEFLNYVNIPDTKENRQVCVSQRKVDDFCENTIYEFLGDYWHGNPERFSSYEYNKSTKKTFGELYKETIKKFDKLKSFGYSIKYIWEWDWKNYKKGIDIVPKIMEYNG